MDRTAIHSCLQRIVANDYVIALIVAALWQGSMTIVGFLISRSIDPSASLLSHTFHWDAGWYQAIINDRYATNAASAAFYPLFPVAVQALSAASFGLIGTLESVQIVNLVSLWLGMAALLKISRHFAPARYRFLTVVLLLVAPAAFFMHMFYSEALFIAVAFWAYALALEKRWLFSCLLLAVLTACRLPALLFVGLCFLEFCRSYNWHLQRIINKKLLLFFITPLGFIGYGAYLALVRGNFFAMFAAYKATNDWAYQVFNPNIFETVARASYQVTRSFIGLRPIDHDILVNHLTPLLCLGLLLVSSLYLIIKVKGKGIPLGVFGLMSFVMFTLNGNVVSVHRYALACISIYIALTIFASRHKWSKAIFIPFITGTLFIQAFLLVSFINNTFAG